MKLLFLRLGGEMNEDGYRFYNIFISISVMPSK